MLTHAAPDCMDLLSGLLQYDPDLRLSARQALRHPYFKDLRDADKRRAKLEAHAASPTEHAVSPSEASGHKVAGDVCQCSVLLGCFDDDSLLNT